VGIDSTYVIIDHKGYSKATDTTKSRVQHEISVGWRLRYFQTWIMWH